MHVISIKTRIMLPPQDDLWELLDNSLPKLRERDVVVVTSKIVSIGEGRCVSIGTSEEKRELIEKEAEYLARFKESRRSVFSVKGHTVVGSAGIDESNGNGYWTLWPEDPFKSARGIWAHLRKKHTMDKLGVIITDSTSPPMRLGCTGISIGFFGFHPLLRYIGKPDIFGRKFKFERANLVDGIAAAAVVAMGEGNEQTPLAIIRDLPHLRFAPYDTSRELLIRPKEDIYYPLFKPLYAHKRRYSRITTQINADTETKIRVNRRRLA